MHVICHTMPHEKICHKSENTDTPYHVKVVSMMLLKLKNSFGIDGNVY